jgi:DNA-binding MarR family transcriptional regulator
VAALGRAGHEVDARLDAALETHGLSLAKIGLLGALAGSEQSLPLGALAERLACVRSNITQLVDRLEADGLVRRVPAPDDRRSVHAEITPLGRARWTAGAQAMAATEADIVATLAPAEQAELAELLHKLLG